MTTGPRDPFDPMIRAIVPRSVAEQRQYGMMLNEPVFKFTADEYKALHPGRPCSRTITAWLPWTGTEICDDDQVEIRRAQLRLAGFTVYVLGPMTQGD